MSLALSTLMYEWRRYLGAIISLAVAGLLVLAMAGLFMGLSKSLTAPVDRSPAQVMILPQAADNLFDNHSLPRRTIPQVYEHPDVLDVKPLSMTFAVWSNFPRDGQLAKNDDVTVMIVDPGEDSITVPNDFTDSVVQALREPFAVVIDRSNLSKLGVRIGDRAKINDRTVFVRATTEGYPSMLNSLVFMSGQTAKLLSLVDDGPRVGALAVKIKRLANASQVAAELNDRAIGQYKAWSREDLSDVTQKAMLKDGGIAVMLGLAVVVGMFIGIVITWQSLQGAIMANIKEFASLRALGVSIGSVRLVIFELSLWIGISGLVLSGALTVAVWGVAKALSVPIDLPLFVDAPVAVGLLIIAVLSGLFSMSALKKSQPADLLR